MAQYKGLKIGLLGFVIAVVGAIAGFAGFEIGLRWLSIIGFVITGIGVAAGCIGILYGWITEGKQAITGGLGIAKKPHK
jgi:hypothetical protein